MARSVADCALLQNVIAGPHPIDVVSLRPTVRIPERLGGIDGWKIAVSINLGDYPVDPEIASNTWAAAEALRQAGATVEEVELNWSRADIDRASMAHYGAIFGAAIGYGADEKLDLLMPYTRAFIKETVEASEEISYLEGLDIEGRLYAELGPILEQYSALICPTVAIPGLLAGHDYVDTEVVVDGVALDGYFDALMTIPFNIASRCPALSVPSGRTSAGLPTGIQIVGPTYDDESVFRVAAALEQVRPWFCDPDWRPPL
jgi:aspartyl-tRNA(Asn)/glutamyl-tRNA(Gln) amidotransferase subunit A